MPFQYSKEFAKGFFTTLGVNGHDLTMALDSARKKLIPPISNRFYSFLEQARPRVACSFALSGLTGYR